MEKNHPKTEEKAMEEKHPFATSNEEEALAASFSYAHELQDEEKEEGNSLPTCYDETFKSEAATSRNQDVTASFEGLLERHEDSKENNNDSITYENSNGNQTLQQTEATSPEIAVNIEQNQHQDVPRRQPGAYHIAGINAGREDQDDSFTVLLGEDDNFNQSQRNEFGDQDNGDEQIGVRQEDFPQDFADPIAVPVEENLSNLQTAVAYDPNKKSSAARSMRRKSHIGCCILILIAIAIVGVSLTVLLLKRGKMKYDNMSYNAPEEPAPYRETIGIRERVELIVGGKVLEDKKSPYSRALDWITHTDPRQLLPNDDFFMQRYVAAYFYYATSTDYPWPSCSPNNETDQCTVYSCYVAQDFDCMRVTSVPWLSRHDVCQWAGIICDKRNIVKSIYLNYMNLTGTFPEGVKYFPYLQELKLSNGHLRGPLYENTIRDLKHLVTLTLYGNQFTGTIPQKWWTEEGRNLHFLDLSDNLFTGTFASGVSLISDMKELIIGGNKFRGTIPTEIGRWSSLHTLECDLNQLTGTIPSEIGNLHHLLFLELNDNQLSGSIPSELGRLSRLRIMDIGYNPISGDIPEEFWAFPAIVDVRMSNCNLIGTLSEKMASGIKQVVILILSNNHFTGTVPDSLGQLTNLQKLELQGNDLTGTIPESICQIRKRSFWLQTFEADCLPSPTTGIAELPCTCCTSCCNANGDLCISE